MEAKRAMTRNLNTPAHQNMYQANQDHIAATVTHIRAATISIWQAINDHSFDLTSPPWSTLFSSIFRAEFYCPAPCTFNLAEFLDIVKTKFAPVSDADVEIHDVVVDFETEALDRAAVYVDKLSLVDSLPGRWKHSVAILNFHLDEDGEWRVEKYRDIKGVSLV